MGIKYNLFVEYFINELKEMKVFAKKCAKNIKAGDTILLEGGLGAGKTTLVSFILLHFGTKGEVASPTFNILKTYKSKLKQINHFDLYRIKNAEELIEIGFEELILTGTNFIEWPLVAAPLLPASAKKIFIEKTGQNSRKVSTWF